MIWPQIVVILLLGFNIGVGLVNHGKPRENWSFWVIFFGTIIEAALLYFGGFWNVLF